MMKTPDFNPEKLTPAALPAALEERLLSAMLQASEEERECREMEQLLRRMRPADMPARVVGHLGVQMHLAAQSHADSRRRKYRFSGGVVAAAAAVLMLAVATPLLLLPGNAVAENEQQGIVSRNIIEPRGEKRVEWRRGGAPRLHYQVLYEDKFVLDQGDSTTVIRVPNVEDVEEEVDYL
jgi:hypothetical protein